MLGWRVAVGGRRAREAKARVVDGDAPESVTQALDHVAVQERPGRIAVQQEQRWAGALVDVVDRRAVDLRVVALEWIQLLREPRRSGASVRGCGVRCHCETSGPRGHGP